MSKANRNARWSLDDWNIRENWVKTYPVGRVCDHAGCATILSKFNASTTCEACQPEPDFLSYLGKRFKRCDRCGEIAGRRGDAGRSYTCPSCTRAQPPEPPPATKPNAIQKAQMAAVVSPNRTMSMEMK